MSDSNFTLGLGTLGVWATKNVSFGLSKFVAPNVRDFIASLDPNLSWYLIKTPLSKMKGYQNKKIKNDSEVPYVCPKQKVIHVYTIMFSLVFTLRVLN